MFPDVNLHARVSSTTFRVRVSACCAEKCGYLGPEGTLEPGLWGYEPGVEMSQPRANNHLHSTLTKKKFRCKTFWQ